MPKTVLLHIGTEKTGTTSIQEALAGARDLLGPTCYPRLKGFRDHNWLSLLYFRHEELPLFLRQVYPKNDRRFRKGRREIRQEVFNQLASASSAVISAEALGACFTPSATRRLRDDLEAAGFREFHVILYVRDPAEFFLSQLQQILKSAGTAEVGPRGYHPASFTYDFRRMAQTWEQVFPGDLVVRDFPGADGFDVVADFATVCERYLGTSVPRSATRMNPSLSAESMQILQDYRLLFSPDDGGLLTPDTARLAYGSLKQLAEVVPQNRPVLRKEVAEHVRANHRADAEFIRSRYGAEMAWSHAPTVRTVDPDQPYRVRDLVEYVDQEIVRELLLRIAHAELVRPPRRSLPRRIAGRAYRSIRPQNS